MVGDKKPLLILLILVLASTSQNILVGSLEAKGNDIEYYLEHQWAKIWILPDGTIDLLYDIEITCNQGEIRRIDVLQPREDFTVGQVKDDKGRILRTESIVEDDWYAVRIWLSEPLPTGSTVRLTVVSNVGKMIWEDETNESNVGMQFIPATWRGTTEETSLKVSIVLPEGVTKNNVKTTETLWDNAYHDSDEGGKLVLYWEEENWDPRDQFECGVSFPKEYVERYERKEATGFAGITTVFLTLGFAALILLALIAGIVAVAARAKRSYVQPVLAIESLGVRRGLTAVEAAQLLETPLSRIVVMMLYSLMKKHVVWVRTVKPTLKLRVMETLPETLHYYEYDFLKAVRKDGILNEELLAKAIMTLRSGVRARMRGYCRKDTIDYYTNILNKAWEEVRRAQTPELMSNAYDERLLWLLLDEKYQKRTEEVFEETAFYPNPGWWWYQYNDGYYSPSPRERIENPGESLDLREIPGVRFADTVASAMEQTANRFVLDIEKFADSIIPETPPSEKTSHEPIHQGSSCVCACANCACVCACVSCACACASGGGGVG